MKINKRHTMVIGIVLIVSVILFIAISFRQEAQTNTPPEEEASIVERGQVTDKVREYSKEFKKLYPSREGRKFSEIIEENERSGKEEESISGFFGEHETIYLPGTPKETREGFLNRLACSADAIVIGVAKSKSSHMTVDETFIYTLYELSVEKILKNNSTSSAEINNVIEVARSGGFIKLDHRLIKMEDYSYEPLRLGNQYLLFLQYVPGTKGYVAAGPEGDFILEGDSYAKLARRAVPKSLEGKNDPRNLADDISETVKAGCKNK